MRKLKHVLIASPENGYRPWITSTTALALFCVVAWGMRILITPQAFTNAAPGIDAVDLMAKVNAERTQRYLPALRVDERLNVAAAAKSNDMLSRSYFAHVDPDGKYAWSLIEATGYKPYVTLGENLAMDFTTSGGVVAGWMNSPGHRANILNEKFEDQGMAAIYGLFEPNHSSTLVTNLFGTLSKKTTAAPKAATAAPKPTAPTKAAPAAPAPKPAQQTPPPAAAQPEKSADQIKIIPTANEPMANEKLPSVQVQTDVQLPASAETGLYYALRIIFTIFAATYVLFLVVDSIIIHKAKVARTNIPSSPHTLLFLLFALINIFTMYL